MLFPFLRCCCFLGPGPRDSQAVGSGCRSLLPGTAKLGLTPLDPGASASYNPGPGFRPATLGALCWCLHIEIN